MSGSETDTARGRENATWRGRCNLRGLRRSSLGTDTQLIMADKQTTADVALLTRLFTKRLELSQEAQRQGQLREERLAALVERVLTRPLTAAAAAEAGAATAADAGAATAAEAGAAAAANDTGAVSGTVTTAPTAAGTHPAASFHAASRQFRRGRSRPRDWPAEKKCIRCGRNAHRDARDCRAAGQTCRYCGKVGHFASVCCGRSARRSRPPTANVDRPQRRSDGKCLESSAFPRWALWGRSSPPLSWRGERQDTQNGAQPAPWRGRSPVADTPPRCLHLHLLHPLHLRAEEPHGAQSRSGPGPGN